MVDEMKKQLGTSQSSRCSNRAVRGLIGVRHHTLDICEQDLHNWFQSSHSVQTPGCPSKKPADRDQTAYSPALQLCKL